MIAFNCPSCSQAYKVSEANAGKRAKCKQCGVVLAVPQPPELGLIESPTSPPQPKQNAPLMAWWNSRTHAQKFAAWGFLVMLVLLVVYTVIDGLSDRPPRNEAPAQPFPVAPHHPVSKLTRENYLAVRDGMVEDEVILILGKPTERWAWPEKLRRGNVTLIYRRDGKEVWVNLETVGDNVPKVTSKRSSGL